MREHEDLYCHMSERQTDLANQLNIGDREKRLLEPCGRGTLRLRDVLTMTSLRRQRGLRLVTALYCRGYMDLLDWKSETGSDKETLEPMIERLRYLDRGEAFQCLDLHPTSTGEEVEASYAKLAARYSEAAMAKRSPEVQEAATRIRKAQDRAYATLKDPASRRAYREETFGAWKVEWYAEFQYTKGDHAMFLRGDAREARALFASAVDLTPKAGLYRAGLAYAEYRRSSGSAEQQKTTRALMERAIALAPKHPRVYAVAARFEMDCGRRDALRQLLLKIREVAGSEKGYSEMVSAYHLKTEG